MPKLGLVLSEPTWAKVGHFCPNHDSSLYQSHQICPNCYPAFEKSHSFCHHCTFEHPRETSHAHNILMRFFSVFVHGLLPFLNHNPSIVRTLLRADISDPHVLTWIRGEPYVEVGSS